MHSGDCSDSTGTSAAPGPPAPPLPSCALPGARKGWVQPSTADGQCWGMKVLCEGAEQHGGLCSWVSACVAAGMGMEGAAGTPTVGIGFSLDFQIRDSCSLWNHLACWNKVWS